MNITFIAPPAAGKGTQAVKISKEYGIPHISTGDLLRKITDESLKEKLKSGEFASDELINHLLKTRLKKEDCNQGYVLDGYPRTLKQANDYEQILQEQNKDEGIVIILDLDKEISESRIIGRRICPSCGSTFNELFIDMKEKEENICDFCKHKLVKRADDNIETFETRYKIYEKETMPLVKHYENKGISYHVNSGINPEFTFEQIKKIIGGLNDKH